MFLYNFKISLSSLKRNPFLTLLMVVAVALGIGLSMTITSIYYVMSSDPIPDKSDQLYIVRLDSWNPLKPYREPDVPPSQLTYKDALALLEGDTPVHQVAMFKTGFVLQPEKQDIRPFQTTGRATGRDFFKLFDVPFLYGNPWGESVDQSGEQVVILSRATNEKVFGGENSIDRTIRLGKYVFRVVGVLDNWRPAVKYFDTNNGPFDDPEDFYIPFSLAPALELPSWGNTNGWKGEKINTYQDRMNSEMVWIQYWVELKSNAQRDEFKHFIDSYVLEQKKLGRFERPLNNRVTSVVNWLDEQDVEGEETSVLLALAFMFLVVCMLNVVGLILAKFSGKSAEISIRRALGAGKSTLFSQHLIESGLIGLIGGVLGLFVTWLGLRGINLLIPEVEKLTGLDPVMVVITMVLSIVVTLLAGVYPTWKVCQIQPAYYLKTQ